MKAKGRRMGKGSGGAQTGTYTMEVPRVNDEGTAAAMTTMTTDSLKEKMMEQPFAKGCNSFGKFKTAREWVKANGGAVAVKDALAADGFVEGDALTLGVNPFNVFARLAGGAMPNPADQSLLGKHAEEFMVCHNRPEADAEWNDESKVGTASMAGPDPPDAGGLPGHVFITCKDLRWDRFNVLVMGMEGAPTRRGEAGVAGDDAWQHAWQFLQRLEAAAEHYVSARGWDSDRTGMYFNVFPLCDANSLHMHVVNIARKGPALRHHAHRNMPLAAVMRVMAEGVEAAPALTAAAAAAAGAGGASPRVLSSNASPARLLSSRMPAKNTPSPVSLVMPPSTTSLAGADSASGKGSDGYSDDDFEDEDIAEDIAVQAASSLSSSSDGEEDTGPRARRSLPPAPSPKTSPPKSPEPAASPAAPSTRSALSGGEGVTGEASTTPPSPRFGRRAALPPLGDAAVGPPLLSGGGSGGGDGATRSPFGAPLAAALSPLKRLEPSTSAVPSALAELGSTGEQPERDSPASAIHAPASLPTKPPPSPHKPPVPPPQMTFTLFPEKTPTERERPWATPPDGFDTIRLIREKPPLSSGRHVSSIGRQRTSARASARVPSDPGSRARSQSPRTPTLNPVLARERDLTLRRRAASASPRQRETTSSRVDPSKPKRPGSARPSSTPRSHLEQPPRRATTPERHRTGRAVKVDLITTLPSFTAAVDRAVAASSTAPHRNAGPPASVRRVAIESVEDAVYGPPSKYRPAPVHKMYSWYKHYGFAGRGAKTSWGYNPKRVDIGERYAEVMGATERC